MAKKLTAVKQFLQLSLFTDQLGLSAAEIESAEFQEMLKRNQWLYPTDHPNYIPYPEWCILNHKEVPAYLQTSIHAKRKIT
jgi:hypothetical protein